MSEAALKLVDPNKDGGPKGLRAVTFLERHNIGSRPDWTVEKVRQAYNLAQNGELELVSDLCDALLTDPRIRGVMQTRVNAVLGAELSFQPVGTKAESDEITTALADGEFWEMYPEDVLRDIKQWGLLLNIGLAQITWNRYERPDGSLVWQQRLHWKHPRNLRWDWEKRQWHLRIQKIDGVVGDTEEIPITPGDGEWVMYRPFGETQPWTRGLVWPLAILFLVKAFADYDWSRRNEARGQSALVGTTPDGALDEDRDKFAAQLQQLKTRIGIAVPFGYDVKAVEFGVDDHDTFKSRIELCDSGIAILLIGQNLTTEVKDSGSYAAGKAQERVRQDFKEWDAQSDATWLRKDALSHFARVRFSAPARAPFPKWNVEPSENVGQRANIVARAADALTSLLLNGVDVDIETFCKNFKIPIKSTVLRPPKPAPVAAPGNAAKPPPTKTTKE